MSADPVPDPVAALLHDNPPAFTAILGHYAEMFTYDAGQRLSTFQYFLSAFAFLTAAFTAIVTAKLAAVQLPLASAPLLCLAAYVLALLFGRLDRRNAQLIRLDQLPLARLQAAIADELGGGAEWHSFREARAQAQKLTTYGSLLPLVYWVAATIAASGGWVTARLSSSVPPVWAAAGGALFSAAAWIILRRDLPLRRSS